jgi:hypothetical protein
MRHLSGNEQLMPEKTQLLIHNPCHEQWGDMQPNTEGRFCGSCQKTVVDLTMMSDQELLAWFAGGRKNVCGRAAEDQLNRDLAPARAPKKRGWALWWQLLVAGLLVSSKASSQVKPAKETISQAYDDTARSQFVIGKMALLPPDPYIQIVDSVTQKPLPGASVQVDKDRKCFIADSAGKITIPYHRMVRASVLKVSCIGYAHAVIPVDRRWLGVDKVVKLSSLPEELPAVSVTGYGTITCSKIMGEVVTVRVEKCSTFRTIKDTLLCRKSLLTIYPNPVVRGASVTLSLRMDMPGSYMAQLYSGGGMVVESMRIEGVDGARTELMDIPGTLAAGVYFVRVFHLETGKMFTEKVVVL